MNMTIAQLLKACHEANYVHFPRGLIIWRVGGVWHVRVCREDKESVGSGNSDAHGDSAEAALEVLRKILLDAIEARAERLQKEAQAVRESLLAFRGAEQ